MPKTIDINNLDNKDMIVVHCVTENEDGSANVELDISGKAMNLLIELGFQTLLTLAIEQGEKKND